MPSANVRQHDFPSFLSLTTNSHVRYLINHQPGKALPYAIRLRWPNVFDLIRDHNLFTDVQDQALLLVEFDQELEKTKEKDISDEQSNGSQSSPAIALLVEHTYSIPVSANDMKLA